MDAIDCKIVKRMMEQGRITWAELGAFLGLSAPAAADRVRRLEEYGVIKGYSALVDPGAVGCGLTALIAVTLDRPEHRGPFLQRIQELTAVQECHHVAGDADYILKVRCAHISNLEVIASEYIKGLPGVIKTRTTVVLSTVKETTVLPLSFEDSSPHRGGREDK